MKFHVDVQLPGTLARWLLGRNCDAIHALELDLGRADDQTLWRWASDEGHIMISKAEDFFISAMRSGDEGRLLWLRIGNCRTVDLLSLLNSRWSEISRAFGDGQRIVEVR